MDLYIECPVCEFQFSTPGVAHGQPIVCPSCSRSFPRSRAVEIAPPGGKSSTSTTEHSRLTVPPAFETSATPAHQETPPTAIPTAKPLDQPEDVAKKPILALQRKHRDRRRLISTLVSSVILATIIGILGGLLYLRLQETPLASNGIPGTVLEDSDSETETRAPTDTEETETPEPSTKEKPREEPPISIDDLPPPSFTFPDNQQKSKLVWDAVRPQLVSLKVHDGLGSHDAVGTIVDSRGWVLTSYRAVKGASKIEVQASVQTIDDVWKTKPLSDLVRGYIAIDPDNDLVLLSVNRRFVVAFSMVQPIRKNNVVQGEYLLQCAPPSRKNVYGVTESKIVSRSNLEGLDATDQSLVHRLQLASDDLVWLVATNPTVPAPGTPIFKLDGQMAAINVFNSDSGSYFVAVDPLDQLIKESEDMVQPLSELGGPAEEGGPIAVAPSNPMYASSVLLNQLAESCRAFDWTPQSRQQYETLQEFAQAFETIKQYADAKQESTVADERTIIAQKDQIQQELTDWAASLTPESESRLAQMNKQFAAPELPMPTRRVPFFGEVHYVDIVNEKLILKLIGTDAYAIAPFVPNDNPMRMQTRWLFFATTPAVPSRLNYRISESELVTAESIDSLLNFGEQ